MASPSAEFWLKSATALPTFINPPTEQYVAELLANQPWTGWSTGEVPFHWERVDRPEAGTALISFLHPPHRPPPPDGLRYLPSNPPERSSITTHLVSAPTSGANPTLLSQVNVELETLTSIHGHWPPTSRNSGLLSDSPEMKLSRFRKRYHIRAGAGHPGLWFTYWGKDENGGAGGGGAPNALAGWEREPVRAYPLPKDTAPTDPVLIFGGRNRPPAGGPGALPGFAPPGTTPLTSAPPPSSSSRQPQPQPGFPTHSSSSFPTPYARQQQQQQQQQQHLAPSLQSQPQSHQALQAQYQLQQQQHSQQQALAHQQAQQAYTASVAQQQGSYSQPGLPPTAYSQPGVAPTTYGLQAAQLQAHQQANAAAQAHALQLQQQNAQILLQQQQQAQKQAARHGAGGSRSKPPPPPPPAGVEEEVGDVLDLVTARGLAMARLARNHELLAGVLDPWRVGEVLEGKKRRREGEEGRGGGGRGEVAGGVGGGAKGGLTELACTAVGGGAKEGVEERRAKLRKLLEGTEKEVEEMERAWEEKIRGLGRRLSAGGVEGGRGG